MTPAKANAEVIAKGLEGLREEVRLSVYGAPCGHTPPSHYPDGYGGCKPCRYPNLYSEEDCNDETRW